MDRLVNRVAGRISAGAVLAHDTTTVGPYQTASGWRGYALFVGPDNALQNTDAAIVAAEWIDLVGTLAAVAAMHARSDR